MGRILMTDVRTGYTFPTLWAGRTFAGDEVARRLLVDQQPVFSRDNRQVTEGLVRGKYAVALGVDPAILKEFQQSGLGRTVKPIHLPDAAVLNATNARFLFNRAPHPNVARLFINWVLSREGHMVWTRENQFNTRRTDVEPAFPERAARPGQKYLRVAQEEGFDAQVETRKWLESLVQ